MKGEVYAFFAGRAKIKIEGVYPEEFINQATKHGVKIWNPEAEGKILVFETDSRSLRKLKKTELYSGSFLEVIKKTGPVALLRFLGKRKFLLLGFICFCLAIYYLSGLVWSVELEGLEDIERTEVMEIARESGIYQWASIRGLNLNEIEKSLYIEFPKIAWVAVERQGTKIRIRIVEKDYGPMQGAGIDIVAEYDGIIIEMMVLKGIPQVEPGMTVAKGDVLIASCSEGDKLINAAGAVKGKVFLAGYGEAAIQEVLREFTGKQRQVDILRFWGKNVALRRKPSFTHCEIEDSSLNIYGSKVLLLRRIYSEINITTILRSPAEADELALKRAQIAADAQVVKQAVILRKEVEKVSSAEGMFSYRVLLTVETEIGCERMQMKGE